MAFVRPQARRVSGVFRWQLLLALAVVVALAALAATQIFAGSSRSILSDKRQYNPGETVILTGLNFAASSSFDVVVERPGGSIVIGDGSETPGWDTVLSDTNGDFVYLYLLNDEATGISGEYLVRVYDAGAAQIPANELATTNFFEDDTAFPTSLTVVTDGLDVTVSGNWQWDECDNVTKLEKHVGFGMDWDDGTGVLDPGAPPNNYRDGVYPSDPQLSTDPTDPNDTTGWTNADHCDNPNPGPQTGDWGPFTHTYAAPGTYDVCVIIYDIHIKNPSTHPHTNPPNKEAPTSGNHSTHPWENLDNSFDKGLTNPQLCELGLTLALPTATSTATPPPPTPTPTATFTPTPVPPTATFTPTPVPPTSTFTPTPVPPTATNTPTPVPPTATFTPTPIPPTATFTPTEALPTIADVPTSTPTPSATPTDTATNTPTGLTPLPNPRMAKLPALQNVWLTRQSANNIPPTDCLAGTDVGGLTEQLSQVIISPDPKNPSADQQIAAFEFEVHYDNKKVCVDLSEGSAWTAAGAICIIEDSASQPQLEGVARIGCVTTGKGLGIDELAALAQIDVYPQPEIYSQAKPNQDNGVVVDINNVNCDVSDEQGHPIPIFSCDDASVTFRYLEGDIEPDCVVDALDAQSIAFRWGVSEGSVIYKDFMNLEPSGAQADGDIDVNDLQFVYGRLGSVCSASGLEIDGTHPPQPPVNPKS